MLQRPQAEWPGEDINFRKPLAVNSNHSVTVVGGSLTAELSELTTGQLSPTNCGGARKLATSEKIRESGNKYRYKLFGEPEVTGEHTWSEQIMVVFFVT